jgi:hypothetical protein
MVHCLRQRAQEYLANPNAWNNGFIQATFEVRLGGPPLFSLIFNQQDARFRNHVGGKYPRLHEFLYNCIFRWSAATRQMAEPMSMVDALAEGEGQVLAGLEGLFRNCLLGISPAMGMSLRTFIVAAPGHDLRGGTVSISTNATFVPAPAAAAEDADMEDAEYADNMMF